MRAEGKTVHNTGDNQILKQLQGVAYKLTSDHELQKDLMQEMFVHLVQMRTREPGQTLSWYIKSCEFHARNHLKLGRSIDSHKRAKNGISLDSTSEEQGATVEHDIHAAAPIDLYGELITNDLVDLIMPHLTESQQRTLLLLMKGMGVREIARELGVTHPAIIKHRKKIARVAREFLNETSAGSGSGMDSFGAAYAVH